MEKLHNFSSDLNQMQAMINHKKELEQKLKTVNTDISEVKYDHTMLTHK